MLLSIRLLDNLDGFFFLLFFPKDTGRHGKARQGKARQGKGVRNTVCSKQSRTAAQPTAHVGWMFLIRPTVLLETGDPLCHDESHLCARTTVGTTLVWYR